jgi:FMN phosphatase YigB (HAD superfamily)
MWREAAEAKARRKHPNPSAPEVTLEEIYDELPRSITSDVSSATLAQAEAELERSITFPDLEVVAFARQAQQKHGVQLALVSDTYFSERQLRYLLDRTPFDELDIGYVLTSSTHRTGKGQALFDALIDQLDVPPGRVLHVGDHPESDVEAPRKAGIHAVHFDKFPEGLQETVAQEQALRKAHPYQRLLRVTPGYGDFGLTALRAKAARRWEGDGVDATMSPYWQFGATVLGPVFTGFAEWVHDRAREEGVETVFGVMREGEFLCRLVNGARAHVRSHVAARPVYLSRRVCSAAAVTAADEEELRSFLNRRHPPTVREFCDELGISAAQLPEVGPEAAGRMDDPDLQKQVLDSILARQDVRNAIVARSAGVRERLVNAFLRTVEPQDGRPILLVDLGWGATIQASLVAALRAAGIDVPVVGLYLLTTNASLERMLDGVHAEGYLATAGLPEPVARWVTRSPEILEQACMVDSGSVVDFTSEGEPIVGDIHQSPAQQLQRNAVQRGITAFQDEWARYAGVVPEGRHSLRMARDHLRSMLVRFVLEPTVEEATMFSTWMHDENFGSSQLEGVFVEEVARSLRHLTPEQFLELPMSRVYWPFGLAALHHATLVTQAAAVATDILEANAFHATDPLRVSIQLDDGGGYRDIHRVDTRSNVNGLSFLRAEMMHRARGVKLLFGEQPAVVRLDSVRAVFSFPGESEPRVVLATWPDDFAGFAIDRCARLAPNLLIGTQAGPVLWLQLPNDWPSMAYRVELEVSFAALNTPRIVPGPAPTAEVAVDLLRKVKNRAAVAWRAAERSAAQRSGLLRGS